MIFVYIDMEFVGILWQSLKTAFEKNRFFQRLPYFIEWMWLMVEFIIGQAGSGKTTLMFERIKNNTDKSCIIVPEQFSYEFDKTLYFYLGAEKFNEQTSLSFTGLSRELFQLFGEPDRKGEYANEYARMIMIYQAINSVRNQPESLNFFRRQSLQSGFAEEVLDIINDMKRSGIEPQQHFE